MYIELDEVLWAIVVTGLPVGTEITGRERKKRKKHHEKLEFAGIRFTEIECVSCLFAFIYIWNCFSSAVLL